MKESGRKQVENLQYSEPAACCGYGYGVPMNLIPNSYRADGLFSQFGLIFNDYEACFVMTASEMFNTKTRDCLWRHFPAVFCEACAEPPAADEALKNRLQLPALPDLPEAPRSATEKAIDNKIVAIL